MALWSNASVLDRKIEGSNPAANFLSFILSFEWTTIDARGTKNELDKDGDDY